MAHGRWANLPILPLLPLLAWLCLGVAVGCGPSARLADQRLWRDAEVRWQRGEPTAYHAWRRLDPGQPYGQAAWARLAEADVRYRRAVEILRNDEPGLREVLAEALATAPMDPALYLPLARACRERGSAWRAIEFYRKFLASRPSEAAAAQARAELAALAGGKDPIPVDLDSPPAGTESDAHEGREAGSWVFFGLVAAASVGGAVIVVALIFWRRGRSRPLRALVLARPEIQQTVAYAIGCLRHEFLKHRIGAAGEALAALAAGRDTPDQRRFLEDRLCRGEPLLAAWHAHVAEIERCLGVRFALAAGDPGFRQAEGALGCLTRAVASRRPRHLRRVETARVVLDRLDRDLAALIVHLASCPIDEAFLRECFATVRAEWASGQVDLDEVVIGPVPAGVAVDIYRTDLRIVLKNLLRNAIAALGASPRPRRLAMDVLVELEPTGEEAVRLRIRDSSEARPVAQPPAEAAGVAHGLGIVRTALMRYDGTLEIAGAGDGYAKAVVVRLFRSQDAAAVQVEDAA